MKATELRELSDEELAAKAGELRGELFNLKVKHSTGQLEDTARLSHLRRDVARLETVIRERREATAG
ncbi:MAG: 50S ribosomal protein L29 [Myxococcales bacterium]|nr:50S ribosomal protein L29 [Myxococcales bacterium]